MNEFNLSELNRINKKPINTNGEFEQEHIDILDEKGFDLWEQLNNEGKHLSYMFKRRVEK